jgi:hypothetical protein
MTHSPQQRRPRQRGAGTMEVLVAALLTLVVALAIMGFFDAQERAYASLSTYATSQNVTRTVVDLMTREIRMSSYDPLVPGAFVTSPGPTCPGVEQGLIEGSTQRIRIQQDLTGDGLITAANEDVTYTQVGSEIRRIDTFPVATTVTLVENVPAGGFRIRYFDSQATPAEIVPSGSPALLTATQRACVQKVVIEIEATVPDPYPNSPDLHSTVRSGVTIRNRWITSSF